jgi:Glutamyl-tRNAGlu reductase, dimerisation domain
VRGRLGTLSPEQELAVEALTRGIISKIMHTPISTLKTAVSQPEATTVVEIVRRLFDLHDQKYDKKYDKKKEDDKKTAKSSGGDSGAKT